MEKFDFRDRVHFAVHTTPIREEEFKLAAYLLQIVIKGADGIVVHNGYTGLEKYAYPFNGFNIVHGINIFPDKAKLLAICKALNYLIYRENIVKLSDVTPQMLYRCFDAYRSSEKSPGSDEYVKQSTLDNFVNIVCAFFANLSLDNPGMQFRPENLLRPVRCFSRRNPHGRGHTSYVPLYHKKALPCLRRELLREIPVDAIPILLEEIRKYDPMIYFAVVLQLYAGLRAGECMNLRREDSPLSDNPGIALHYLGSAVSEMLLDLSREYVMRSDNVDVGKIKRETDRMTPVYPPHIPIVVDAYEKHLKLLGEVPYEREFAPMFVGAGGKAMTVDTYQRRFDRIVRKRLRTRLLLSSDPQLKAFGQALLTSNFPTHGLRHYFSVRLALDGLDAAQIMAYRGDRNVDSALVYLRNKGVLETQLRRAHSIALDGLTAKGEYKPCNMSI